MKCSGDNVANNYGFKRVTATVNFSMQLQRLVVKRTKLQLCQMKMVEWGSGLEEIMVNYFSNLFTVTSTEWSEVINCVSNRVNEEHNSILLEPVHPKEVKTALFSMHPDQSPGPDGMSPGFYKKYGELWEKT